MGKIGSVLRKTLVWTYERGTLQYDIICALILVFIFFVPRGCFNARRPANPQTTQNQTSHTVQPGPAQNR